jgi:hypothetical protein
MQILPHAARRSHRSLVSWCTDCTLEFTIHMLICSYGRVRYGCLHSGDCIVILVNDCAVCRISCLCQRECMYCVVVHNMQLRCSRRQCVFLKCTCILTAGFGCTIVQRTSCDRQSGTGSMRRHVTVRASTVTMHYLHLSTCVYSRDHV